LLQKGRSFDSSENRTLPEFCKEMNKG